MSGEFMGREFCPGDGNRCYVGAGTDDAHFRCGTSACRSATMRAEAARPKCEVELLAKEIGAEFRPEHNTLIFRARWAAGLAAVVRSLGQFTCPYREKLTGWLDLIDNTTDQDMARVLAVVRAEIEDTDCDDGWASDPAGAALEAVTLSMIPKSRWMAEAGGRVWGFVTGSGGNYNDVIKFSRNAWLCDLYAKCARWP